MRRALLLAAFTALALARPEMYKEKEDFQYSRSSSDEGAKAGFYGAQRGNMGGNYERSHNMDLLAQHQMGGLVRNVEGELGDGAKQKSGSVYSAAKSRGVFGSGHYDLSNLEGRHFQEGTTFGDSQSHSSLSSNQASYGSQSYRHSSGENHAHGSQLQNSRYHGYQASGNTDQALYSNSMQSADNLQSASDYDRAQASSHGTGYYSGYEDQSAYNQAAATQHTSNAYGSTNTRGSHYRLISASPVKVYVRPGSTVTIPVAAQSFDDTQSSASTFDRNSINTEVEALGHDHGLKPTNNAKHYETSYSYRKQWEKHDTIPVTALPLAIPTVNPYPSNSELYEDAKVQGSEQHETSAQESRNVHSSSQYRGYNAKSGSSRHHASSTYGQSATDAHQAAVNTYGQSASDSSAVSSNTHGAYNYGAANLNSANLNSQVEDFGSKPKSYQSSYSYHKSWERQGDPYVIYPSTNGHATADSASQKLTSLTQGSNYGSHQYGTRYHQGHGYSADCDCDENGHIRVARSYNLHERPSYQQGQDYFGQQSQKLEDLGQQSQNLEYFGQESQNLQDFGQQSQNLEEFGQQSQKLEDLGQHSQNLEDLGQQSQNLDDFSQQSQKLEDFGQQSQNLESFGQQSQNFGQETQNLEEFGQQIQDLGQQTQTLDRFEELGQQAQTQWDQQSQTDAGQETQNTWSMFDRKPETKLQSTPKPDNIFEVSHPPPYRPFLPEDQYKPFPFEQTSGVQFDQETAGRDKDVMQSEDMNQNTGTRTHYWHSYQTNTNQDAQNGYAPVTFNHHPEQPDWHKVLEDQINAGYAQNNYQQHQHQTGLDGNSWTYNRHYNYQPYVNTGYSSNSWVYNPSYSQPASVPHTSYGNTYTNTRYPFPDSTYLTQTYVNYNNHSKSQVINITDSNSLTNLWSFLDDTEKKTLPGTETDFYPENWHSKEEEAANKKFDQTLVNEKELSATKDEKTNTFEQTQIFNSFGTRATDKVYKMETTTKPMPTTTVKQDNVHQHKIDRGDIAPEKHKPQEEPGRGDIGPDNSSEEEPTDLMTKPYKTLEEIETLSLTKDNDKAEPANANTVTESANIFKTDDIEEPILSVLSLKDQKTELSTTTLKNNHGYHNQPEVEYDLFKTTSTTPRINYGYGHSHYNEEENDHNVEQQFENTEQQSYNQLGSFDQQNQHNVEQQLSDFSQQVGDFGQHAGDFGQQPGDFDQQPGDFGQQLSDFGQQPDDFVQQLANFGQQSEQKEQQLESFDQQSVNTELQNANKKHIGLEDTLNQFKDLGQETQDFGQETQDFGQQTQDFGQETPDFGQQTQDLGQQSQDFGQQIQDSGQQIQDFGQQTQDFGQQTQDFGQQSEGFQQDSLGDFGQHEQFQQESFPSFENQQEKLKPLEQETENLEQQSQIGDLWQPDEQQQASQVEVFAPPSPYNKEGRTPIYREPVVEQQLVPKKLSSVQDLPLKPEEIATKKATSLQDMPPETVTDKPGFWNKVGNKFTGAKDKIKSWFSSS